MLLCYVTDRQSLAATESGEPRKALLLRIEGAAAAGVDWIQIREKDLSGRDCASLTREALQRAAKSQAGRAARTRIIVNDRLDVALTENADGVHLGEKGVSAPIAGALACCKERGLEARGCGRSAAAVVCGVAVWGRVGSSGRHLVAGSGVAAEGTTGRMSDARGPAGDVDALRDLSGARGDARALRGGAAGGQAGDAAHVGPTPGRPM